MRHYRAVGGSCLAARAECNYKIGIEGAGNPQTDSFQLCSADFDSEAADLAALLSCNNEITYDIP